MARAAVSGRLETGLAWLPARLASYRQETAAARTLVLLVPGWPPHLPGQHADVRLTAEDGYSTERSYSLAGPADGEMIELTVQRVADGEVSPYLTEDFQPGDQVEVRGPVGGWFVWRQQDPGPVLLVAGGSGLVPLMAMIRTRRAVGSAAPFRLICSVRTPADLFYAAELQREAQASDGVQVSYLYTRTAPPGSSRPPGRISDADIEHGGWPAGQRPACFVCGPTGFVEAVADALVRLGHETGRIKTERFGPTGA